MKFDIFYPIAVITTCCIFTFCRRFIISDAKLNRLSFEFSAYAFFMTVIMEIALMLLGSWNCVRDQIMKILWFVFGIVFVTLWSVFRQHRLRTKFDSEMRNVAE
jgi:hypothetical protein